MKIELTAHESRSLAVRAEVDPGTVRRWARGLRVRALSRLRLNRAAVALGILGERLGRPEPPAHGYNPNAADFDPRIPPAA